MGVAQRGLGIVAFASCVYCRVSISVLYDRLCAICNGPNGGHVLYLQ